MRRFVLLVSLLAAPGLGACSHGTPSEPAIGQSISPIINGEPDGTHDAVVALLGPEHSCSGTIVAVRPPSLYVLTAAHCVAPVAPSDPEVVAMGPDYASPDATFLIESCQAHPDYDGEIFDFAMCRAIGASSETPFIPVQPAPDELEQGTWVSHVGYGVTDIAGWNTRRTFVLGQLSEIDDLRLWYEQAEAGPCFGDSGGPQLTASDPERVVGVTSFGDPECSVFGASGRVSAVAGSFIMPYVESSPGSGGAGGSGAAEDEPKDDGAAGAAPLGEADGGAAGATGQDDGLPKGDGVGWNHGSSVELGERPAGACALASGGVRRGKVPRWPCALGAALGLAARRRRLARRRPCY
jgi:hypothetical protein